MIWHLNHFQDNVPVISWFINILRAHYMYQKKKKNFVHPSTLKSGCKNHGSSNKAMESDNLNTSCNLLKHFLIIPYFPYFTLFLRFYKFSFSLAHRSAGDEGAYDHWHIKWWYYIAWDSIKCQTHTAYLYYSSRIKSFKKYCITTSRVDSYFIANRMIILTQNGLVKACRNSVVNKKFNKKE